MLMTREGRRTTGRDYDSDDDSNVSEEEANSRTGNKYDTHVVTSDRNNMSATDDTNQKKNIALIGGYSKVRANTMVNETTTQNLTMVIRLVIILILKFLAGRRSF